MAFVRVRVEVGTGLRKHLAELVDDDIKQLAEKAASRAREIAPVDSGEFVASIHIEKHEHPASWRVGSDDPRAVYIEYGTSDTPAHATIRRAVEDELGGMAVRPYTPKSRP